MISKLIIWIVAHRLVCFGVALSLMGVLSLWYRSIPIGIEGEPPFATLRGNAARIVAGCIIVLGLVMAVATL